MLKDFGYFFYRTAWELKQVYWLETGTSRQKG